MITISKNKTKAEIEETQLKRHRIEKDSTQSSYNSWKKRNQFSLTLRNKFDLLQVLDDNDENVEPIWQGVQRAYTETVKDVLGFSDNIQKPWMSNSSWKLIDERKAIKKQIDKAKSQRIKEKLRQNYRSKDREVKISVRRKTEMG